MGKWTVRILETHSDLTEVENLQAVVWPGDGREIVPSHLLTAAVHNGGLLLGAYASSQAVDDSVTGANLDQVLNSGFALTEPQPNLAGFVFGFPGMYETPDGPRILHVSHMLAVHPDHRNSGIGFRLKRAQWQMVRNQGIDRIIWTYDPLLSRNAFLNIARLGAVCNTYRRNYYGEMRDGLNAGLPSDRFVVDWWVNSRRVTRRLSQKPRPALDLAHFLAGEIDILNPSDVNQQGLVTAAPFIGLPPVFTSAKPPAMCLLEIPADFQSLRSLDRDLALDWRQQTRQYFEFLFAAGYLATDFIHLSATKEGFGERSFYVMTQGESTF